jgi:WD40 repeat protein
MDENTNKVTQYASISIVEVETDNPFGTGFISHTHGARIISISPDSKWIAFAGWDESIQVCELLEGGRSLTYRGHKNRVHTLEWSPNGKWIASASMDNGQHAPADSDIQIWEPTTGQLISHTPCNDKHAISLAWSPDSAHLAFGTWRSTVHLLQPLTGETKLIHQAPHQTGLWITAVAWSPDGTRLASSASDGAVEVWHVNDGSTICRYLGHFSGVNAVAWSPDGISIASGGDDKTIQVWNASTREPISTYKHHDKRIMNVAWSRDGQRVRSGSWDGSICECNAHTGEHLTSFHFPPSFEARATIFAWNTDATIYAMGLEDRKVAVADMIAGNLLFCRAPAPPVELMGQGHKEQQDSIRNSIRSGQSRSIPVWGMGNAEKDIVVYRGHSGAVKSAAWSPDSQLIASGGHNNTLHIWDTTHATLRTICHGHLDPVVAVAWSPDGQKLISGSLDTTIRLWDASTGHSIADYRGHTAAISSLAWSPATSASPDSPNTTRIASSSEDGTVQIWDTEHNIALTYRGHQGPITTIAWSPDARFIASGGEDKTVQIWDATTGETFYTYRGHIAAIMSVAWSPDSKRIVSSSDQGHPIAADGTPLLDEASKVHIWDALTGNNPVFCNDDPLHTRTPAVAWSPNGSFVAAGNIFGQIKVYDPTTGETIAAIHTHLRGHGKNQQSGSTLSLSWSPNGHRLAASFSGGLIYIWPIKEAS